MSIIVGDVSSSLQTSFPTKTDKVKSSESELENSANNLLGKNIAKVIESQSGRMDNFKDDIVVISKAGIIALEAIDEAKTVVLNKDVSNINISLLYGNGGGNEPL
ncbi:MAG: hypothetical protein HRT38_10275 [Alteromonadaceae bacterium]|nr:hypothetical protein [Alteromonadaceae bacterium]